MKAMRNLAYCMLAVFLISACGPVARGTDQNTSGVRAWFDAPLPNTVFFPPVRWHPVTAQYRGFTVR